MNFFVFTPALFIFGAVLTACADRQAADALSAESAATEARAEEALVTIDGSAVTQSQLQYALSRLTSGQLIPANQALNEKVLQSLVASRAMALLQEKSLTEEAKAELALKVAAYREELLVKGYINAHATPQPVTTEHVKTYYQKNPKEFGGDNLKAFEYIASVNTEDDDDKAKIEKALAALSFDDDWRVQTAVIKNQGLAVVYKKAKMRESLLQEPVRSLVEKTEAGAKAPLLVADDVLVLKVTSHQRIPAKPFAEVSSDIRKALAPTQMKSAVRAVSEQAIKKVTIEYKN